VVEVVAAARRVREHDAMHTTNGAGQGAGRVPRGAKIGIFLGCSSWAIAFSVLAASTGRVEVLVDCALPVLLSSAVVALLLLALLQWKASLPAGTPGGELLPMGGIWSALGLLLVLADGFVTPVLEADSRLADTVRASGGVLRLPIWVALAALTTGGALLAVALRRIARANG
jgi:hypothetical protein